MTKKALYIFEYDDGTQVQAEWFVSDDLLDYKTQELKAKEYLADNWDCYIDNLNIDIINIYPVDHGLISKVYESKNEK